MRPVSLEGSEPATRHNTHQKRTPHDQVSPQSTIHAGHPGWRRAARLGEDRNWFSYLIEGMISARWRRAERLGEDRNPPRPGAGFAHRRRGAGPQGSARIATLVNPILDEHLAGVAPGRKARRGSQHARLADGDGVARSVAPGRKARRGSQQRPRRCGGPSTPVAPGRKARRGSQRFRRSSSTVNPRRGAGPQGSARIATNCPPMKSPR